MRNSVITKITKYAKKNEHAFLITGDAGFGVLDEYKKLFKKRFLNLGVAEQNMMSFSAGLALSGFKVFVYDIIPFLLFRCYEQVRNDICYQRLPVTLIGIGSGVTYAPQGVTHYSIEDIAIARTLPNLVILSPADPIEAAKCIEYAIKINKPTYIRIAKSREPNIHTRPLKSIESPIVLKNGSRVAVLFHGSVADDVMEALKGLKVKPKVISVPKLQPLDFVALSRQIKGVRTIITAEEHYVQGGLGSIIEEWILRKGLSVRLKKLGIKNEFVHAIKNRAGMRDKYGISASRIRKSIKEAF